jgi:LysM repeat protein
MKAEDEWLASVKSDNSPIISDVPEIQGPVVVKAPEPTIAYPEGEFKINETRVIYARSGTSLLAIAEKYDVPLKRIIDFNELSKEEDNSLPTGQLIYLQRKRKSGANEFHLVADGESTYDICQLEAIRLETLLEYNHLANGMQPAVGEKLYLRTVAPSRPELLSAKRTVPAPIVSSGNISQQPDDAYLTHVVKTKETLYAISRKYNVPVEKLREWNKLESYEVKKGQELIIYKN